jgi:Flp pilus assembly pilin Flp
VLMLDQRLISFRASCKREEGQTMAEYGVVLAVITAATLSAFTAFSDVGIQGAINRVIGIVPG